MIRKLTYTYLLVLISITCHSQELTTIILVRHSEKVKDGSKNPPLNKAGAERSTNLAALFTKQDISALYATPFKRTQETLQPIADQKELEIQSYEPFANEDWLKELIKKHKGGTIIISGHSNTIPNLSNVLLGDKKFTQFDESDYSNLIVIVANEVGKGKLIHINF